MLRYLPLYIHPNPKFTFPPSDGDPVSHIYPQAKECDTDHTPQIPITTLDQWTAKTPIGVGPDDCLIRGEEYFGRQNRRHSVAGDIERYRATLVGSLQNFKAHDFCDSSENSPKRGVINDVAACKEHEGARWSSSPDSQKMHLSIPTMRQPVSPSPKTGNMDLGLSVPILLENDCHNGHKVQNDEWCLAEQEWKGNQREKRYSAPPMLEHFGDHQKLIMPGYGILHEPVRSPVAAMYALPQAQLIIPGPLSLGSFSIGRQEQRQRSRSAPNANSSFSSKLFELDLSPIMEDTHAFEEPSHVNYDLTPAMPVDSSGSSYGELLDDADKTIDYFSMFQYGPAGNGLGQTDNHPVTSTMLSLNQVSVVAEVYGQRWDISRSFGEGSIIIPDLMITGPTPECESSADFFSMDESKELIFDAELDDPETSDSKLRYPPEIFESGPSRNDMHWNGEDVSDHMFKIQEDDLPEVVAAPSDVECRTTNEVDITGVGIPIVYRSTSLQRNQTRGGRCNVTQTKRRSWTSLLQVLTGVIPTSTQNSSGDQEKTRSCRDGGVPLRTAQVSSHERTGREVLLGTSILESNATSRQGGITTRVGLGSVRGESTPSAAKVLLKSLQKAKAWYMRRYRATKIEGKHQTSGDIHYSSAI